MNRTGIDMFKLFTALLLLVGVSNALAEEKWNDFAQLPLVEQPRVSPDGSKIAMIYNTPDGPTVSVSAFGSRDFDILASLRLGKDRVDSISWSGNKYIIVSASSPQWSRGEHYRVSRLYAFDVKNKSNVALTERRFSQERWYEYTTFKIVSLLKNDEEHILVSTYDKLDEGYSVFKVNLSSGKFQKVQNNKHDISSWSAVNGVVRLGVAFDREENVFTRTIWYREKAGSELKKLHTRVVGKGETFNVIGLTKDGNKAYILSDREIRRESIWLYDIALGEFESMVLSHPVFDISGGINNGEGELIGGYYSDDYSKKLYFDPADAAFEKSFSKMLNAAQVTLVSRSIDKTKVLVAKQSDSQPTLYVHFDLAAKKGGAWVRTYPALANKPFSSVENYSFNASDGQELTGYLTMPNGVKQPPLIVYPHGGPHARDYKYFDPQLQYFVSMGYAVLQVNFRGSAGFGNDFETAGYFQWGKRMQQDVYDAMDWVIGTNRVSRDKACIVGGSYGGYVALTASFQQPERFDCVVSIAGLSDLKTMVMNSDNFGFYTGHIVDVADEEAVEKLDEVSAINYIDKITAPILLIHGNKDTRVDYNQSESFYDEAKRKIDVKYVEIKNGTHFFDDNESQQTLYREMTAFLETHLKH